VSGEAPRYPEPRAADAFGFRNIRYEKSGYVATVTINRPHVYNCVNYETLQELRTAFRDASFDDAVAVVVLTGAGEKAFSTGADLDEQELFLQRPRDYWKWMGAFIECHETLRAIGKPTIARLNGIVVGGGNEFNISCDLAVMVEDAYIRHVGPSRGSVPAAGATQWLPLIVGDRRAREILWLNDEIPARQALEWGLVNRVLPRSQLDAAVGAMAETLYRKLPDCIRYTRTQTNFWKDFSWHMTVQHAREWLTLHAGSPEVYEGLAAFRGKRSVDYDSIRTEWKEGSPEYLWGPHHQACPECGAEGLPARFDFCGRCGGRLEQP
jgi:enoyl-CoA hydratase/carnithine racemase